MHTLHNVIASTVERMKVGNMGRIEMSLEQKKILFEKATSNMGFDYDTNKGEYYYESVDDAFRAFCAGMEWERIV